MPSRATRRSTRSGGQEVDAVGLTRSRKTGAGPARGAQRKRKLRDEVVRYKSGVLGVLQEERNSCTTRLEELKSQHQQQQE
ncbi:unnamed protein product, partial [Chrysoparadoxa australica]